MSKRKYQMLSKENKERGLSSRLLKAAIVKAIAVQTQALSLLICAKLFFHSRSLMGKGFLTS